MRRDGMAWRRFLAVLIATVLVTSTVPTAALAEVEDELAGEETTEIVVSEEEAVAESTVPAESDADDNEAVDTAELEAFLAEQEAQYEAEKAHEQSLTTLPEDPRPTLSIHDANEDASLVSLADLPSSYSSVEAGHVTSVKNQDPFNTCWAFAATAAAEASLVARGIATSDVNLSERHLSFFTYHNAEDALGYTYGDKTIPIASGGYDLYNDLYLWSGGYPAAAIFALASGMGAVMEDDTSVGTHADLVEKYYSYIYRRPRTEENATAFLNATALDASLARSRNSYILESSVRVKATAEDAADIKAVIREHGGVTAPICYDGDYYQYQTASYYKPESPDSNHIVTLVGWDDDYAASNFAPAKVDGEGYMEAPTSSTALSETEVVSTVAPFANSSPGVEWLKVTPQKSGKYTFSCTSTASLVVNVCAVDSQNDQLFVVLDRRICSEATPEDPVTTEFVYSLYKGTTYYFKLSNYNNASAQATVSLTYTCDLMPKANGAWLAKNSWGTDWGNNGYFWISYEDGILSKKGWALYTADLVKAEGAYDNLYQHDGSTSLCYNTLSSGGSIANVFTAKGNEGGAEKLTKVALSLTDVNVDYAIQVYRGVTSDTDPTKGEACFKTPVTGHTTYGGFYTITLPEPVMLAEGKVFSIVITLSHKDGSPIMYDIDASDESSTARWVSMVKDGQSFEKDGADARWFDLASDKRADGITSLCCARIKAYTTNVVPSIADAEVTLSPSSYVYSGKACEPSVTVRYGSKTLTADTDYTVAYKNNVNVGLATVTVEGTGAYEGSKELTYRIGFKDVAKGSWYYNVVYRANDLDLVGGYSGDKTGTFGPNDNITRGDVAVILWRMAGKPVAGSGAKDFPDVKAKDYYYAAIRWASSVGVVSGNSDGTFAPKNDVKREELAAMLRSYYVKVGGKTATGSAADYASMFDASKVSSWARNAVGFCFKNKILSGKNGKIAPQDTATRAEIAKMIVFLYDMLNK